MINKIINTHKNEQNVLVRIQKLLKFCKEEKEEKIPLLNVVQSGSC